MKSKLYPCLAAVGAMLLAACSPAPESLEQTLRGNPAWLNEVIEQQLASNPQILFRVIEENPEAFMSAANHAVQEQKRFAQERSMDEAFANPKTPSVAGGRVIFGNPEAPVTVVEYSDFQCPYCAQVSPVVKQLLTNYGDQVRVVYKHLPLDFHDLAVPAARYYEAIGLQDPARARAFHDKLFDDQQALTQGREVYMEATARELGVDMDRLTTDLDSEMVSQRIEADTSEARSFGISGTPAFLINGVALSGSQPYANFQAIIDRLLANN